MKTKLSKSFTIILFWISNFRQKSEFANKLITLLRAMKRSTLVIWTPLFKRSSYISFLTFLKRFTKRK